MDWSKIVREAAQLAQERGYVTFNQLNGLMLKTFKPNDIGNLLEALSAEGVRVENEEGAPAVPAALACSFCGKPQSNVLQLIASAGPFICNECVQLCVGIIATEHPDWLEQHRQFLTTLPLKPED